MTRWLHAKAPRVFFALTLLFTVGPGSSHEYYPSRVAWDRFTGGQLNISTFSFRDVNRNGVYDIADHPMSGVAFEVTGPGTTIFRRTNKSGFGNFAMSIHNKNSDIKNRGEYAFLAIVPSGWRLTTDNASQKIVFEIMPGTPADVVASTPLEPVGLAQDLTITGKLLHSTEIAPVQLSAISPAGEEQEVSVDEAGLFSFPVADGNWTVVAKNAVGNLLITRGIEVSVAPVVVAALVPEEPQHEIRQRSTLISFDDLVTVGIKEIPSGYHGLNWHNWVVTHQKFHDGEGYVNTTMSGEFVA